MSYTLDKIIDAVQSVPAVPGPWRIYAHHSVPFGRAFNQYRTDGKLLLWVNRGWVADLKRQMYRDSNTAPMSSPTFGIPIYYLP